MRLYYSEQFSHVLEEIKKCCREMYNGHSKSFIMKDYDRFYNKRDSYFEIKMKDKLSPFFIRVVLRGHKFSDIPYLSSENYTNFYFVLVNCAFADFLTEISIQDNEEIYHCKKAN